MKTMNRKLWVILVLMVTLMVGCTKDETKPEEDHSNVPVAAEDLGSVLAVLEMGEQQTSALNIVEFRVNGNSVSPFTYRASTTSNAPSITVYEDNVLSYITGPNEFKYTFARHKNGNVHLKEVNVYRIGEDTPIPQYSVKYIQTYKKTDLLDFTEKVFKQSGENSYLSFKNNGDWKWSTTTNFDAAPTRKYEKGANGNAVFETPDFNPKHIGVYVPQWNNVNKPVLLVLNNQFPKDILQFEEVK